MKILFICDEYPPGRTGGIGTAVQNLARQLKLRGHQVWCLGLYPDDYGGGDRDNDQGVSVIRIRYQKPQTSDTARKIIRHLPDCLRRTFAEYRAHRSFVNTIQRIVIEEGIDIIEMPDWNTYVYDLGIEEPLPYLGIPVTVKLHCSRSYLDFETGKPLRRKWLRTDRAIFMRADSIAAVSHYIGKRTNDLFHTTREFEVIYNLPGNFEEMPALQRQERMVIFAGTLVEHKGIGSLMQAWNQVIQKIPDAKLLVVGKGDPIPYRNQLDQPESVEFTGHLPKEKLLNLFRIASLAALPSFTESFGMVAVEAIYCGCPLVFTKRGAGPEVVIDGKTGLLTDPGHPEDIASKIIMLLENRELRERLAAQALEDIRTRMSEEYITRLQERHYENTIEHFRRK